MGIKMNNTMFVFRRWINKEGFKVIPITILGMIFKITATVFTIVLASQIIGILEKGGDTKDVFLKIIVLVVTFAVLKGMQSIFDFLKHMSTFIFRISESPDLFEKLTKLPFHKLEGSVGKEEFEKAYVAIGTGNSTGVEALVKNAIDLVSNIICLIIVMTISARLSPLIMLVLLLSGSIRLFKDKKNREWLKKTFDRKTGFIYRRIFLQRKCLDSKIGKDARVYGMDGWFQEKFDSIREKIVQLNRKESLNEFLSQCIDYISGIGKDIICLGYLVYRVSKGMSIEDFTLYLVVIERFNTWIKGAFDEYAKLSKNAIIVNNYREYLSIEELGEHGYEYTIPRGKAYTYQFENVSFSYESGKKVFENLNLRIEGGEKIALVGINGAGKTTLVKLMCGLYLPHSGRVLINGVDTAKLNPKEIFEITGVVFQETKVFPDSIWKNISCRPEKDTHMDKVIECLKRAELYEYIQNLKDKENTILTKNLDTNGIELSGGQYQKLMLARALYKDADTLILDEPTAALDPIAEGEMYRKYDSLTDGKTSLFISHRLSSTQFCDRVIFLQDGKIEQEGSHLELMEQEGPYREMFNTQAHYYQEEVAVCKG